MAFQETPLVGSSDTSPNKNPKSVSENSAGFCECNICLESARDPVVTLCGHLYCWPCIYKWLHAETNQQPNCPVCKAHISGSSLVPLYGRGNTPSSNEPESGPELKQAHQPDLVIPNRPSAPSGSVLHLNQQQIHPVPFPAQPHAHPFGGYAFGPGGPMTVTGFSNPIVGMVGEMVCGMIFRSAADTGFFAAAYPYGPYQNPYPVPGTGGPRVRRQVMQVEKSLNRLTIFMFICFTLCFLLF